MKGMSLEKKSFGKNVEDNLKESLRLAGINVRTSAELDHNHKIDFVVRLKNENVGIQFSLRRDDIKARVAKICALDVVPRFIYLSMAGEFFDRADKKNGGDLHRVLAWIVEKYSHRALWVNIDHRGLQIQAL